MSAERLTLFLLVLVGGIVLFTWAHLLGKKQKAYYENEALDRLEKDLKEIKPEISEYNIYQYSTYRSKQRGPSKSSYQDMINDIIENCTKCTGGNGVAYYYAKYSLHIDKNSKTIYYVIDAEDFNFNNII